MTKSPFGILRINNSHTRQPGKTRTSRTSTNSSLHLSQSQTLPIGLVNVEEKENQKQSPQAPKKEEHHSHETVHTFLIALVNLTQRFQLELLLIILMGMHLQTLHKLCTAKQKAREGKTACGSSCCKETSCSKPIPPQLLWYPSLLQPTSPVPKGFSAEYNTTHQGAATTNC